MYQDGNIANPLALALILVAHNDYHKQGIMPEIQNLVDYLDRISFMSAIKSLGDRYLYKYQNGKQKFLAFPICRYADEEIMKELTKQAPGWKTGVSGIYAPPLVNFREAIIYSDTKSAMMFADKMHDLGKYAALRGLSENDFRDTYLSDIGLDKNGRKEYDLGTQKVTAVLQKDMSFLIETEDGKMMKSVPKKDSDLELFEIANKDFKNICSQAKKIIKNRADKLFEDFLSGNEKNAESWMKAYLENKLLQSVAEHIVWSQGDNSFIVSGKDIVDVNGNPCEIKQDVGIKVAHPMEMETNTVDLWRDYLKKNRISQPFEQIWELAYKEEEIREDRYRGCGIYWRRVQNADKHGIHFFDEEYHNIVGFYLDDCQIDYELDNQMRHMVSNDSNFILGEFRVNRFTRKANHIIWLFDKWTIWNRIKNDDMKVMELIERYNEVQINEFINIAIEKQATKLTAALMSYKEENFKSNDAFEDYVLEW